MRPETRLIHFHCIRDRPMRRNFFARSCCWLLCSLLAVETAYSQAFKPAVLDSKSRLEWFGQHLKMQADASTKELKWRSIGPMVMSGRVTDIAVPSGQPFTYYIASASGGLWKTDNEATSWQPIFEALRLVQRERLRSHLRLPTPSGSVWARPTFFAAACRGRESTSQPTPGKPGNTWDWPIRSRLLAS